MAYRDALSARSAASPPLPRFGALRCALRRLRARRGVVAGIRFTASRWSRTNVSSAVLRTRRELMSPMRGRAALAATPKCGCRPSALGMRQIADKIVARMEGPSEIPASIGRALPAVRTFALPWASRGRIDRLPLDGILSRPEGDVLAAHRGTTSHCEDWGGARFSHPCHRGCM